MPELAPPRLAEVYPALVDYLETALMDLGEHSLVDVVRALPYLGWCDCSSRCRYLRTGAMDAADSAWVHIEDDDEPRVWLQLDRSHTTVVGMEILEFDLG